MKILKFGTISENAHGKIVAQNFELDCQGKTPTDAEFIELVVARMRQQRLMPDLFQLSAAAEFERAGSAGEKHGG